MLKKIARSEEFALFIRLLPFTLAYAPMFLDWNFVAFPCVWMALFFGWRFQDIPFPSVVTHLMHASMTLSYFDFATVVNPQWEQAQITGAVGMTTAAFIFSSLWFGQPKVSSAVGILYLYSMDDLLAEGDYTVLWQIAVLSIPYVMVVLDFTSRDTFEGLAASLPSFEKGFATSVILILFSGHMELSNSTFLFVFKFVHLSLYVSCVVYVSLMLMVKCTEKEQTEKEENDIMKSLNEKQTVEDL